MKLTLRKPWHAVDFSRGSRGHRPLVTVPAGDLEVERRPHPDDPSTSCLFKAGTDVGAVESYWTQFNDWSDESLHVLVDGALTAPIVSAGLAPTPAPKPKPKAAPKRAAAKPKATKAKKAAKPKASRKTPASGRSSGVGVDTAQRATTSAAESSRELAKARG